MKRYLSVYILPGDTSRVKHYKVPVALLRASAVSAFLFLIVFSFIVYDYVQVKALVPELDALRKETTAQKIELRAFTTKISDLESRMAKLKLFDRKLRIIANLDTADDEGRYTGMGGTSTDEDPFLSLGERRDTMVGKMHAELDQLTNEALMQEKSFTELQEHLLDRSSLLASTPSIWPARGWLTSVYGYRKSPFTGLRQMHTGIDIANRVGTPIIAPADGVVVKVGHKANIGKIVVLSHGYGIKTLYGHLSKILVRVGQKVSRGEKIAEMGNTGRSTGPHLHYQVSVNGVTVDPRKYLLD
ncbi:MAG TPA: M23 family metallopeptidase [Deltaproteobacteria bacterium]|nr:M23 family metallopeptidase [Deltaproteobacteria bacterium]